MTAQQHEVNQETGEVINFPRQDPAEEKFDIDYKGSPLKLWPKDLRQLWQDGLINSLSYCVLAMRLDDIGTEDIEHFNIDEFADRWEGEENDRGKSRRLTHKDIQSALSKLEKVGNAVIEMSIQLKLKW